MDGLVYHPFRTDPHGAWLFELDPDFTGKLMALTDEPVGQHVLGMDTES